MKIIFQFPKPDFDEQAKLIKDQWIKLKEPRSLFKALILSIPFMILGSGITISLLRLFNPISFRGFGFNGNSITFNFNLLDLIGLLFLLVIHELIHLFLIPNFIKSDKTWIGIQWFAGFVVTKEVLSRNRFLLVSLAPYLVISIILPVIFGIFGWLNPTIMFLFIFNALGSSVDLLGIVLILFQVPSKARIINLGKNTFWKL